MIVVVESYLDGAGEKMLERLYNTLPKSLTTVYDTLYDFLSAPMQESGELAHLDTIEGYLGGFDADRYLEG